MFGAPALLILVVAFVGGLFLFSSGPLWLVSSSKVFARGRKAPRWLEVASHVASRLGGTFVLVYWVWIVARGEVVYFVLSLAAFVASLFLLFNGPIWLVVRVKTFRRGPQAPRWMETLVVWFNRVIGGGGMLAGLILSLRYWSLG